MAVDNLHASIKGMPYLSEQQAKYVAGAILELKGIGGKMNKVAHTEGRLKALPKPLSYKGAAKWLRGGTKLEDMVSKGADGKEAWAQPYTTCPLRSIRCPVCTLSSAIGPMKLKAANGCFSNVKCRGGREARGGGLATAVAYGINAAYACTTMDKLS